MYEPRPVRLQSTVSLLVFPSGNVRSPRAPAFITKIGRSGPRPLTTTSMSSAKIGVGAVILELRPSRHNSLPVRIVAANEVRRVGDELFAFGGRSDRRR